MTGISREQSSGWAESMRSLESLQEKLAFARRYLLTNEINPSTPEFAEPGAEVADFTWDTTLLCGGELTREIIQSIKGALGVDLATNPSYRTTGEIKYDAWPIPGATSPTYILRRYVGDGETEILALYEELIEMFPELGELKEI